MQLRANARKAGQEYLDKAFMHGRFPSALPRSLTARSGQLTPQQQYVYDDFARIPRTAPKEGEALRSWGTPMHNHRACSSWLAPPGGDRHYRTCNSARM